MIRDEVREEQEEYQEYLEFHRFQEKNGSGVSKLAYRLWKAVEAYNNDKGLARTTGISRTLINRARREPWRFDNMQLKFIRALMKALGMEEI